MDHLGWPKGKPRKGHIKKDGTQHAKWGAKRITQIETKPETYKQTEKDRDLARIEKPKLHGATGQPVIEPCPNCGYAYADGGYCMECGYTKFSTNCPHCITE